YRFITTHLESLSSAVRAAQAAELIAGPANTDKAIVLAGGFNSDADSPHPFQNEAYIAPVAARVLDSWITTPPHHPGITWPLHGEDPFTPLATPSIRIDLALSRGAIDGSSVTLIGNAFGDLTPSGLWPSDHAGLVASFVLRP